MKLLYTLCLCLVINSANCCSCVLRPDFKLNEDLKEYNFIALVSIKALSSLDSTNKFMHLRKNGDISIEIIEQFKGDHTNLLIDENFANDCAFNIQIGEQWLFFGRTYNGKTSISKCSYSVIYQQMNGLRDWKYFTGIKQLDVLKNIYGHNTVIRKKKEYYPNGNIEVKQAFKHEKLNGIRKIYYPNGQRYVIEKFKNGTRFGFRNTYTLSRQLECQVIYQNGLIKQRIAYQDTTEDVWYLNYEIKHHDKILLGNPIHDVSYFINTLYSLRNLKHWEKQIRYIYTYSKDGRSYQYKSFNYKGDLEMESYLDWDKQLSEQQHFYESGKTHYVVKYDQKANIETEYDCDANGKRRDFVKKCDACKFYFNKDVLAAQPEPGYLQ